MIDQVLPIASYHLFDELKDGIIIINKSGLICYYNKRAEIIVNQHTPLQLNKHIQDIVPNSQLLRVMNSKSYEEGKLFAFKEDSFHRISRYPLIDRKGTVIGALAVLYDVNEESNWANVDNFREVINLMLQNNAQGYAVFDEQGRTVLQNSSHKSAVAHLHLEGMNVDMVKRCVEKVFKTRRQVEETYESNTLYFHIINMPILIDGKLQGCLQLIKEESETIRLKKELQLTKGIIRVLEQTFHFEDFIYQSSMMNFAIEQAKIAAKSNRALFIRGEEGTGKCMLANAIHNGSARQYFGFKRIHPKNNREDWIDLIKGEKYLSYEGTIYLEEVNSLSLEEQVLLLKNMKDSTKPYQLIISATEKLERFLINGTFLEELYVELMKSNIYLPSLNERKEDIIPLCTYFLEQFSREGDSSFIPIEKDALKALETYSYGGNVDELKAILQLAQVKAKVNDSHIKIEHLNLTIESKGNHHNKGIIPEIEENKTLSDLVEGYEKVIIEQTLRKLEGNKTLTAKSLGLSVRNLYYKLEKYNLN